MSWGWFGGASGIAEDSTLTLTHPEQGIYDAQVEFQVTSAGTGSELRADATVVWYAHRSAAEYVTPGRFRAVTVTATILSPRLHTVTRTFTAPAVMAQLASALNQAYALPAGIVFHCPAEMVSYELAFRTAPGAHPDLAAIDSGCASVGVTVNGKSQPPLLARFASTAAKLLGL
jgi:hypothetical protein